MNIVPLPKIFNSSIKKKKPISYHQMKRENLYLVNCFLDRETEVLGNMKAISLQLKLIFQE